MSVRVLLPARRGEVRKSKENVRELSRFEQIPGVLVTVPDAAETTLMGTIPHEVKPPANALEPRPETSFAAVAVRSNG